MQASKSLEEMQSILDMPVVEFEGMMSVFTALKDKFSLQHMVLESTVSESWSHGVKWNIPNIQLSKTDKNGRKCVELHIHKGEKKKNQVLTSTAQTLLHLNLLDTKLKIFADRFLQHFYTPIVTCPSAEVTTSETEVPCQFSVSYAENKKNNQSSVVAPMDCFSKLHKLFSALNTHLLNISVETSEGEMTSLMQRVGRLIATECVDLVTKECLGPAIPSNSRDLENFGDVISATKVFQEQLISFSFLEAGDTRLTDFVGNVNELFGNKQCQEILEKARKLMTSEIHNMVRVDNEHPFSKGGLPALAVGGAKKAKLAENVALAAQTKLSEKTFRLPKCYVR